MKPGSLTSGRLKFSPLEVFGGVNLGLFKGTSTLKSTIKNLNIGLTQDIEMCKHVYEWEDFLKC